MIKQYELVALIDDLPNIKSGSIGTVVEIWNNGDGFEVEFLDDNGKVIDCITLSKKQIRQLTPEELKRL